MDHSEYTRDVHGQLRAVPWLILILLVGGTPLINRGFSTASALGALAESWRGFVFPVSFPFVLGWFFVVLIPVFIWVCGGRFEPSAEIRAARRILVLAKSSIALLLATAALFIMTIGYGVYLIPNLGLVPLGVWFIVGCFSVRASVQLRIVELVFASVFSALTPIMIFSYSISYIALQGTSF